MQGSYRIPASYRQRRAAHALSALFLLGLSLGAQESARVDISTFGVVGLAAGGTLTLKATADPLGQGCVVHLAFTDKNGNALNRSLGVSLSPGQSASANYVAKSLQRDRIIVRPVAWVERSTVSTSSCGLSVFLKNAADDSTLKLSPVSSCSEANCKGVPVRELANSTLRLYAVATNQVCRAQMGFRQSDGSTSATAKYVTLMPHHVASLDWRPGDDDIDPAESLTPVVAFHPGDGCLASSEIFGTESEPAKAQIPVRSYESPIVGLAVNPASLEQTIQSLKTELETNPDDIWVVNALAQAYGKHGESAQSVKLLSNQVKVNPRASESWMLLARFQYERTLYASAAASLEKCLELDPQNLPAKAAYAASLIKLDRVDEARALLLPLVNSPKNRTPGVLIAYADLLYAENRLSDALSAIEESDARHPNCPAALFVEAKILEALQRLAEATQSAERAVQLDAKSVPVRILLTRLYRKQGKVQLASEQAAWLQDHAQNAYK